MSLANSNMYSIVKKQYLFKLKSYTWFFFIMIIFQSMAIFFNMFDLSMSSNNNNGVRISIYMISTLPVLVLTILCIIGVIMQLGSKEWKAIDFSFASNNTTSCLSNIAFLITYGLFGAVTSALSATFVRIVRYVFTNDKGIFESGFYITPVELLCSIASSFLYILLFTAIFYFFSILIQKSKISIIPILAVLLLFFKSDFKYKIIYFYRFESSLLLFFMKVMLTALLFFTVSAILYDDMEVER